ncbi:hypothetical protein Dimus_037568 [Dionaea muscipula]
MVETSSGDQTGDKGGRFLGLSDSIEIGKLRVADSSDPVVLGIRRTVSDPSLGFLMSSGRASSMAGVNVQCGLLHPIVLFSIDGKGCAGAVSKEVIGVLAVRDLPVGGAVVLGGAPPLVEPPLRGRSRGCADGLGPSSGERRTSGHGIVPQNRRSSTLCQVKSVPSPGLASSADTVAASSRPLVNPAKVAAAIPGGGKGGSSRSYAAVTVSDMKSDVKLSFVPPVNSNGKKYVVLSDSICSAKDFQFSFVDVRTLENGFFALSLRLVDRAGGVRALPSLTWGSSSSACAMPSSSFRATSRCERDPAALIGSGGRCQSRAWRGRRVVKIWMVGVALLIDRQSEQRAIRSCTA